MAVFAVANLGGCSPNGGSSASSPGAAPRPQVNSTSGSGGGVIDGSGGDGGKSTPEEIRKVLAEIKPKLRNAFKRILLARLDRANSKEANAVRFHTPNAVRLSDTGREDDKLGLLERLFDLSKPENSPIGALDREGIRINAIERGACRGDSIDKDASAVGTPSSGELCFSIERLTRYPSDSLEIQIIALAAHEVSHLYGFNETDARALQAWFEKNKYDVRPNQATLTELDWILNSLRNKIMAMASLLARAVSDASLCQSLGRLVPVAEKFRSISWDQQIQLPSRAKQSFTDVILPSVRKAQFFCGLVAEDGIALSNSSIKAGDRAALRKELGIVEAEVESASAHLRFFSDPIENPLSLSSLAASTGVLDPVLELALYSGTPVPAPVQLSDLTCRVVRVTPSGRSEKTMNRAGASDLRQRVELASGIILTLEKPESSNRGVRFSIEGEGIKSSWSKGAAVTAAKDGALVPQGLIARKLNERVSFVVVTKEKHSLSVDCGLQSENSQIGLVSGFGGFCPDFNGTYGEPKNDLVIRQTGCASIEFTLNNNYGTETYKGALDGSTSDQNRDGLGDLRSFMFHGSILLEESMGAPRKPGQEKTTDIVRKSLVRTYFFDHQDELVFEAYVHPEHPNRVKFGKKTK